LLLNSVRFDTGDLSECAFSKNARVVSNHASFGRNALQLLRKNSVACAEIRGPSGRFYDARTAYYRLYFMYVENATSAGHSPIALFLDLTNAVKGSLHLDAGGRLQLYDAGDTLLATGRTMLKQGGVYLLQAQIGSGTDAPWEVRVNGLVELQGTGDLRSQHNGGIRLGGDVNCTDDLYFAEIAIDDGNYPPAVQGIGLA
jgi:hypothetical protein